MIGRSRAADQPKTQPEMTDDRTQPPPPEATRAPRPPPPARRAAPAWRGIARGFGSVGIVISLVLVITLLRGGLPSRARSHPPVHVAPNAALPGLQDTPAPWPPEYAHLTKRLAALGLPDLSDTVFHIHAMLRIFIDGRPVAVPAFIGIPADGSSFAPLHTHDASGIIHLEATRPYPFTLGQVFDVWGVVFTRTQLGGYRNAGPRTLSVDVNGRRVADGPGYIIRRHDTIIVGYGRPGSFPTNEPGDFSGGL